MTDELVKAFFTLLRSFAIAVPVGPRKLSASERRLVAAEGREVSQDEYI